MTPISTLTNITSEGRPFTDKVNDFSLEIPEGAIPEEMRLTVDVGVALFGPFQFPEGLRPVSPVFWVCVLDNENFEFSKLITVTIPHFLELENDDDKQSLGLTFLKADHNKNSERQYEFQPLNGKMDFKTSKRFGVLQTTHFCSLCIASKDTAEVLTKTCFCITSVLPRCATLPGKKQYGFFFITLKSLRTCLKKVDEIIADKMQDYNKKDMFKFKRFVRKPALEIFITQPKHGHSGVEGTTKVLL